MGKQDERLKGISSAFDSGQLDNFVEKLNPQELGNLLYLVKIRINNIVDYYNKLTKQAKQEVKTEYILNFTLSAIKEAEAEILAKWKIIEISLEEKKEKNRRKKLQ
jgi:hypothetical protein